MALIKCPECGKEISDKAASCPNCGMELRRRGSSNSLLALYMIILIAFLVAIIYITYPSYKVSKALITTLRSYSETTQSISTDYNFNETKSYRNLNTIEPKPHAYSIKQANKDSRPKNLREAVDYLYEIPVVYWVKLDSSNIYIGFTELSSNSKSICRSAAIRGSKVTDTDVTVWAVNGDYRNWKPGSAPHYYKVTARNGKIIK